MSEPLAFYRETRADGRRRFEVYSDRMVVIGSNARAKFETTIRLTDLRPEPDRLWVRQRFFMLGAAFLLGSLLSLGILARSVADGFQAEKLGPGVGIGTGLFFVGFVICLKTFRRVEFASYKSHAGIVLLDVANAGPDRDGFREFVELLTKQIRISQEPSSRS